MTTATMTYTAMLVTPNGASYSYTGVQSLPSLTAAAFQAASAAMGTDIGNQMVNGTPQDPPVLTQQQTDQTSD